MSDTISIELRRLIDRVTGYLQREELDVFHVEMDCTIGDEPYWYVGGDVDELCSHPSPIDWGDDETFFEVDTGLAGDGTMKLSAPDLVQEELDQRIADATFTDASGEGFIAVSAATGEVDDVVSEVPTVKEFWNEFPGAAAIIDGQEVQEARREAANDEDGDT